METVDTWGSQKDKFTIKNFKECVDTWRDINNCPTGMLDILKRADVFEFIFGQFDFQNDEIDEAKENYDHIAMELKIFWAEDLSGA